MTDTTLQAEQENNASPDAIGIPEQIVIKDFAAKIGKPVTGVIAELMKNGIMLSMNERIDFDTASIIAEDLGIPVRKTEKVEEEHQAQAVDVEKLKELVSKDKAGERVERPAVVVVMGHVDHGKTTLLDAIRTTHVVEGEAGGITQSIGAYQVVKNNRPITFIDTPGHEAFTAMRSRGANVADIAILVVAADDGLKPQTHEALEIIQRAGLPFVVAINKIDKPGADVQRVKKELSEMGLVPEDWGGKTLVSEVSAKTQVGIDALLDLVLLAIDVDKDRIMANPNRAAAGTVIESHIDKGAGPVTTVLIQTGTLHKGDLVSVGGVHGKIRIMKDWNNALLETAVPSTPVQILGLKEAPTVGDVLQVLGTHKALRQTLKEHSKRVPRRTTQFIVHKKDEDEDEEEKKHVQMLNLVLKTDTLGSQEAIENALQKIHHEEVQWGIVHKGLGNVNENDVQSAFDHEALLIAFNVAAATSAKELAADKGVKILEYKVIYDIINLVRERLQEMLAPEVIDEDLGNVQVLAVFKHGKDHMIVGGKVIDGKVITGGKVRIKRKGEEIGNGQISQLQAGKQDAKFVAKGGECGMKIDTHTKVEPFDVFEVYQTKRVGRLLE